jgi:hypothetical protein
MRSILNEKTSFLPLKVALELTQKASSIGYFQRALCVEMDKVFDWGTRGAWPCA